SPRNTLRKFSCPSSGCTATTLSLAPGLDWRSATASSSGTTARSGWIPSRRRVRISGSSWARISGMRRFRKFLLFPLLATALLARADNGELLANPGFEYVAGDRPQVWDVFLSPQQEAWARLENTGHDS